MRRWLRSSRRPAVVGVVQPALPGASRALWGRLVPAGPLRDAAYNYEAISMEVFFILGPALAALLVAAPWPGTGLLVAGVATVVGTVGFALTGAVRGTARESVDRGLGLLGVLLSRSAHRRGGGARASGWSSAASRSGSRRWPPTPVRACSAGC